MTAQRKAQPARARALAVIRAACVARAPEIAAGACALGWFYYLGYGPMLQPSFVRWLWRDDWAAYHWGFSFFRNAPWEWPLGSVPNLFYPYGTSVGFTDANPWLCVLFKLLSPLLPRDFQFFGGWYLACFVLQAWFGAQIARAFTRDPWRIALAGALFACTPVLPVRARHFALCGLFFVTAGVWLNLKRVDDARAARRDLIASWLLLAWAAGTHAYLSVMLLALCCAAYLRLALVARLWSGRQLAAALGGAFGVTLAVYYLFGFIGWQPAQLSVVGFGLYSADLSTLFNPQGMSRWLPAQPVGPGQWEGFSYLGAGTLLLLLLCAARVAAAPRAWLSGLRSQWPLLSVSLLAFCYALSNRITWHGELLADLSALYEPLAQLTGTFRSSGRFDWLLHLALIALAVRAADLPAYPKLSRVLLALALALSLAEQETAIYQVPAAPYYRLTHPALQGSGKDYDHLAIVPIQLQWECPYGEALVNTLSDLAYRERLTFNSGNFMRKLPGVNALCNQAPSALDARTIYVVAPEHTAGMRAKGALCAPIEGLDVCVTSARSTALSAALSQAPPAEAR